MREKDKYERWLEFAVKGLESEVEEKRSQFKTNAKRKSITKLNAYNTCLSMYRAFKVSEYAREGGEV